MQWFGTAPFSAACEADNRCWPIDGTACGYCEEAIFITRGDMGYAVPTLVAHDVPEGLTTDQALDILERTMAARSVYRFFHYECHQVGIQGHVHCILTHGPMGVCPDNVERDPPGMSKREAAVLAEQLAARQRAGQLTDRERRALLMAYWPDYSLGVRLAEQYERLRNKRVTLSTTPPGMQWLGPGRPPLRNVWEGDPRVESE